MAARDATEPRRLAAPGRKRPRILVGLPARVARARESLQGLTDAFDEPDVEVVVPVGGRTDRIETSFEPPGDAGVLLHRRDEQDRDELPWQEKCLIGRSRSKICHQNQGHMCCTH